jgi:hypothetical protein
MVAASPLRVDSIHLYRRCLRSIKQIHDPNQRSTFFEYAKDGFRSRKHLHPDSREARLAYTDALEQVASMEYYQQMARIKNDKINPTTHNIRDSSKFSSLGTETSSTGSALTSSSQTTENTEVKEWLLSQLPHLHNEDVSTYTTKLQELGFDSVAFIEEELLDEDLQFMKKAHRRVVMRKISKDRAEIEVK